MSERPLLKTCLEIGSVTALFPILKDWGESDLRQLIKELDDSYEFIGEQIAEIWAKESFKPETFFSPSRSLAADTRKREAEIQAIAVHSEIASVAFYYLEHRAEKRP